MSVKGMLGLMGLVFFCNKCVGTFYKFNRNGDESELDEVCEQAIAIFESLEWPLKSPTVKVALLSTNEEIEAVEYFLTKKSELNDLLWKLTFVQNRKNSLEERMKIAKRLQDFFDKLGDYAFGLQRIQLREGY